MADDTLLTIGELARLTGLTVKTIRFWSDEGLVPPAARTPAGYRLYGRAAALRVGLVRTLRDVGVDLATIRRVVDREVPLERVAAAHADALGTRVRAMRLHQAVLRAVASRGTVTDEEIALMNRLARLTDTERRRLINDFIDDTFADLDLGPGFLPMMRAAMPELPDDPSPEQVGAWVELAELVGDDGFRAAVRAAAVDQARAAAETAPGDAGRSRALAALLGERVAAARAAGIAPDSAASRPIVDELAAAYAGHAGRADGPEFRAWLLRRLTASSDHGYERYWRLLSVINGTPRPAGLADAADWLIAALSA
ncbi:MerR family transcriptional regulator [Actinomadura atramentaria]|uniref:helix-turn-helix domain-containing protein n=1 Tax=Actinomadura atramentaria TaxID=1990 RepID=UPI00047665EC|nr:MerR family transcriptional regulator [Actinomadura atramentaria]